MLMGMQPFDEIVTEHGPMVLRVCRALLGPTDADDAWSDTFIAAMRAYPDLRPDSNVRGWLATIAHRKAIDILRAGQRSAMPLHPLPEAAAQPVAEAELDGDLQAALDRLPAKQQGAVIYRYLADLAYADVAELLECSEAAARRSASDGIAELRSQMKPTFREEF